MSLLCVYTSWTIVRKEPRFRSPHYIPVKNPQSSTCSLEPTHWGQTYLLIGHSFKSVPNERPMTSQGRRPSSANKKGATAMVTPLSIGYVSASP